MKRILCPTDFSDTAMNAIAYAGKLSQQLGTTLTLFNVQSLANLTPEEALAGESWNVNAAQARLQALSDEAGSVYKISCAAEVASTVISVSTLIGSRAKDYDLVVMGSDGPDNVAQFLVGSHTFRVARAAATPLIMIPAGCGYSSIETIVCAFDYWRNDRLPLSQLVQFAKKLGSNLRVLQIMEESYSPKAEAEVEGMQKISFDRYKDEIPIRFDTIHTSNLGEGLHQYVLREKIEMLALCSEDHGFLQKLFHKSVVKEMSAKATYPLFIFHE